MVSRTEGEKRRFHPDPMIDEAATELFLEAAARTEWELDKLHEWERDFKKTARPEVAAHVEAMSESLGEDYAQFPQRVTAAFLKRFQDPNQ